MLKVLLLAYSQDSHVHLCTFEVVLGRTLEKMHRWMSNVCVSYKKKTFRVRKQLLKKKNKSENDVFSMSTILNSKCAHFLGALQSMQRVHVQVMGSALHMPVQNSAPLCALGSLTRCGQGT